MDMRLGMPPLLRSTVAWLLLPLHLAACTVYHQRPGSPADVLTQEHPGKVQLILTDGARVLLMQPRVVADSVVGTTEYTSAAPSRRVAVPLEQVRQVNVARTSAGRVTLGILVVLAIAAVVGYATYSNPSD